MACGGPRHQTDVIDSDTGHYSRTLATRNLQEKKSKLSDIITLLEEKLPSIIEAEDLRKEFEMEFPSYEADIELHKTRIAEKLSVVAVGETCSGKSSFLNLLLDAYILPVSHHHMTSRIIKIQKGDFAIKTNDADPVRINIQDKETAEEFIQDELKKVMIPDTQGNPIEITVYWPFKSTLLQDDVILVDTPGYGEKEELGSILMNYLPKAAGCIYIVNAGNGGGLQEDRLMKIVRKQLKYSHEHKVKIIDPSRALFFFNKWDQIKDHKEGSRRNKNKKSNTRVDTVGKNQEDVWQWNIEKLQRFRFTPEQAMKFSVWLAEGDVESCIGVDNEHQVDQARQLVSKVMLASLKDGLNPIKEWICEASNCISQTFHLYLKAADMKKKQRKEKLDEFERRIQATRTSAERIYANNNTKIDNTCDKLAAIAVNHLKSDEVQKRINTWDAEDLQCSIYTSSIEEIQSLTADAVSGKIATILIQDLQEEIQIISADLSNFLEEENQFISSAVDEIAVLFLDSTTETSDESFHINPETFRICLETIKIDFMLNSLLMGWSKYRLIRFFQIGIYQGKSKIQLLREASERAIKSISPEVMKSEIHGMLEEQRNSVQHLYTVKIPQMLDSLKQKSDNIRSLKQTSQDIRERFSDLTIHWTPFFRQCKEISTL